MKDHAHDAVAREEESGNQSPRIFLGPAALVDAAFYVLGSHEYIGDESATEISIKLHPIHFSPYG